MREEDLQALNPPHLESIVDVKVVFPLTLRHQHPAHHVLKGNVLNGQAQNSGHKEC